MAEKYAKQQQSAICGKFGLEDMPQDVSALGLATVIFDRLILKPVRESRPNLGTLGLWVIELFAMYATDG